jgi:membrane-bound lytic murein transglycosylase D
LKHLYISFFCFLLISLGAQGQEKRAYVPSDDKGSIDSLARSEQGTPTALMIDPLLIQQRLKSIEGRIPLIYNIHSHQFVEYFAFKKAAFTQKMLEKRDLYFPLYEKYLKLYNLPDELKYLSLIESGLETKALSNKGAGGLWQFMPYTARGDFGLRVDSFVDERFDPERATEAACKYMRQLYRIFGDWHMVLAAYNTGPGNVKRAIRKCGATNFWGIYNCLPTQTRNYVPQYIAITYMMNYHWDHQIQAQEWARNMPSDTVHVNGYLNLNILSSLSGFSIDTFRVLNPHILANTIPSSHQRIIMRIPSQKYVYFQENRRKILDSAAYFGPRSIGHDSSLSVQPVEQWVKKSHSVRKGENIYTVARLVDVSVFELKRMNHLRSNRIRKGKKLYYFVKEWVMPKIEVAKLDTVKSQEEITDKKLEEKPASKSTKLSKKPKYYKVRSGDTLSEIADKHPGLTVEKIKKLNHLRSKPIQPGMRLRIL